MSWPMLIVGERRLLEEGIAGHDGAGDDGGRLAHVIDVPGIGVFAADACEIRPRALRAPLEGMVVHAFGGEAVVAVAFDLVADRADHLAMAIVAALAKVDVAARQLERGIGPHAFDLLDRRVEEKERRDLDQAADGDDDQDADRGG